MALREGRTAKEEALYILKQAAGKRGASQVQTVWKGAYGGDHMVEKDNGSVNRV